MPIVVGVVPTVEGHSALRRAGQEAVLRGTSLVIVSSRRSDRPVGPEAAAALEEQQAAVEAELDSAGVAHELRVIDDSLDPAMDLITTAEDIGADLIVIGLRRRTPVGKLILGANAQRILLDASCPVLAVKAAVAAD